MNTSQLSKYAPEARKAFIAAVSAQAAKLGITAKATTPAKTQGDVLIVEGQAFPKEYAGPRERLAVRVKSEGFAHVMEAAAYTWFNRFAAIRYMEIHGYLDHGYRVLSHPEGQPRPEILDHAADVDLPGLDREKAIELKLDGTKDEELYRLLLLAQCNDLNQAMPFLFEKIGDETELLLPANLLHTDSLIRQLVEQVDETLWQEIEIIGWLYQFYISEKKDQVIGKVVKSEDIPAATQLFTPNWIVKYMVQNSLGAQWLATYPQSPLKGQMEYYIEPAEQTDDVNAQLEAITPSQLNPEELTLIDPACGSGHILVEAYELFKAIYLERGYRQRDIPPLILEKNLFGLDIDERAAQLTGFALMMKGRADDRRLFERGGTLNVMALQDSAELDADGLAKGVELRDYGLKAGDVTELKRLFEHAATFGSLIEVPDELAKKLPALRQLSEATSQDLFVSESLKRLKPIVQQAELLAAQYDAVVANPPYMGSRKMNPLLKKFVKDHFPDATSDLFACFIERGCQLAKHGGHNGNITMDSWMFLSSFRSLRESLLRRHSIEKLVHIGWNCFPDVHTYHRGVALVLRNWQKNEVGKYLNLSDVPATIDKNTLFFARLSSGEGLFSKAKAAFQMIPGSPLAYWVSEALQKAFTFPSLGDVADIRQGMATTDNLRFLRVWSEVALDQIHFGNETEPRPVAPNAHWYPYNKGGPFRRWYGNNVFVLDYTDNGEILVELVRKKYPRISDPEFVIKNRKYYFRPCASWTDVTSGALSARIIPAGFAFDTVGPSAFSAKDEADAIGVFAALLNSNVCAKVIPALNPTLHFNLENAKSLPLPTSLTKDLKLVELVRGLIRLSRKDWDGHERSWDFQSLPILTASTDPTPTLESSYTAWIARNRDAISEMKRLEEENNRLFIDAYGLADELTPDVPIEQITLTVNPAYRYGGKLTEEEQWTRFSQDTMEELVSYAIGCMMGRYSLDAPGLIYAHSGNEGFDPSRYPTFPADDDGIVPLTDTEWFEDDVAHRLVEFISAASDNNHLEANLTFLADNLSRQKNESSRETIRRYLCDRFFKDHLQTYKKRPIYWLFSSGKQKAFQCLVYLHRYNTGTLARMRSEYVIPLQGKVAARLEKLQGDIQAATSTAQSKRLSQERAKLEKQQHELLAFDEKLRHYADRRITLDLDDGVKVNYGKFGDLLAEVKDVTGGKADEE